MDNVGSNSFLSIWPYLAAFFGLARLTITQAFKDQRDTMPQPLDGRLRYKARLVQLENEGFLMGVKMYNVVKAIINHPPNHHK